MRWVEHDGLSWLECEVGGARAIFTTRSGGVSREPCAGLNLGFHTPDDPDAVLENRRHLVRALGLDGSGVVWARQVHGTESEVHTEPRQGFDFARSPIDSQPDVEADAQISRPGGPATLAFVADCLPVAVVGREGAAMVHCGWRGLAAGILDRVASTVDASAAAIGPGIGPCCYEVESDVRACFEHLAGDRPGDIDDGSRLDLPEIAERLLRRAGVSSIERTELCTSCRPRDFYSHRRDSGATGRQAGLLIPNR